MMLERGLHFDHTTTYRWVQHYAPELEKRGPPHPKATNDSWRVDESYVKVKKSGCTSIALSIRRETPWNFCSVLPEMRHSAKCFFAKALAVPHTSTPRVMTVDKNAAYPKAVKELKAEGIMPDPCELRLSKYLNNLIEQDHRFLKRLVKLGMGFFSFETAWRTRARDMKRGTCEGQVSYVV